MFKDHRYINAGTVEIYRYGHKAVERVEAFMEARNGYISIPVDGLKYWTIGTSTGKYGDFAKYGDTFFSVNKAGFAWAKEGTDKADKLVEFMRAMIEKMNELNAARVAEEEEEE